MNLNKLKKLSINKDNIMLYDYKKISYINNNNLNRYLNFILNNDLNYYYVFSIDYSNKQINIDVYCYSHILFNININLYDNNDAFNLIDAILNKDNLNYTFNYSIIKINK